MYADKIPCQWDNLRKCKIKLELEASQLNNFFVSLLIWIWNAFSLVFLSTFSFGKSLVTLTLFPKLRANRRQRKWERLIFHFAVPIPKLCERKEGSFPAKVPKVVDGAVVTSRNERDLDCVVTFQTESILERFMIRFEKLAIDCNDKLVIYDGAHAIKGNTRVSLWPHLHAYMYSTVDSAYSGHLGIGLKWPQ